MTTDDVKNLAQLSRIALADNEVDSLKEEIESILDYVSIVKDIVSEGGSEPSLGARYNVLRDDIISVNPGQFSTVLKEAMPHREGEFLAVKKILKQTD